MPIDTKPTNLKTKQKQNKMQPKHYIEQNKSYNNADLYHPNTLHIKSKKHY